jgi:parallel beta-helix repeat protein
MAVADQNLSGGDAGVTLLACNNITLRNITAIGNDNVGVILHSTSNTTMNGINASNCGRGIVIENWNSFCNLIDNCTANNNSDSGIKVSGRDNRIANSTCNWNGKHGISVGERNIVEHSTILGNAYGITLRGSNNKIRFNNVSNGDYGIQINKRDYNKIYGNEIWNNGFGIALWQSSNNSIYENTVANSTGKSGSEPYYYTERDIDFQDGEIYVIHSGYEYNDLYLRMVTRAVDVSDVGVLDIRVIGHSNVKDLDLAVFLDGKGGQPKDGIAQPEEIISQDDMSFDAYGSSYGTGGYAYSADSDTDEAIRFFNPLNGTYLIRVLEYTVYGYPALFDLNITILNYTSSGIMAFQSDCNSIVNNNITGNALGINLVESSELNLVHYNNMVGNGLQAHDDGGNLWNRSYPLGGNFWSDYAGPDAFSGINQDQAGSDGIGDAPYTAISGSSGSQDQYPLMEQTDGIYLDDETPYSYLIRKTSYYGDWGVWRADAIVRDNYSGVANLEIWHRFSLDNVTWDDWELLSNTSYPSHYSAWSFSWSAFDFPWVEGYHEFYPVAIDEEGNREVKEQRAEAAWGADLERPISSVENPTRYWQNSARPINVTAHDNMSGVATVSLWYRYSADNATWANWSAFGTDTEAPWSWAFNFSEGDGHYEFDSVAVDKVMRYESPNYSGGAFEPSLAVGYDATPPVANAGTNRWIQLGTVLTLNGTGSTDNVGISNYSWNFTYDGLNITSHENTFNHTFELLGTYSIILNVTDPAGNWDVDTMRVTVYDGEYPVADAGPDQSVTAGALVTFTGAGSADNVGIENYTWTFTHNGTAITLYGASPTFRFWEAGNHTVTLNVADAAGNRASDTMVVRVTELPRTPSSGGTVLWAVAIAVSVAVLAALLFLKPKWKKPDVPGGEPLVEQGAEIEA